MRYYIEHLPMTIPMGVQSENNAEDIEFDVSDWLARDESMSFSVWVTRPGETEAYQAENATLKDGILCWWPTSADTAIAGEGRVEILAVSANRRILSGWTATSIRETTTETTTEAPVNQRPWLDQALLASEEAKAAATSAAASADKAEGVVKKEIAALTQEIDAVTEGGNGYNVLTNSVGYLLNADGSIATYNDYIVTDYIKTNGDAIIVNVATPPTDSVIRIGDYDDTKQFITRRVLSVGSAGEYEVGTVDVEYVRLSFRTDAVITSVDTGDPTAVDTVARNGVSEAKEEIADCFKSLPALNSNTDLDNVTAPGSYVLYYNRPFANIPEEFAGKSLMLEVVESSGFVLQTLTEVDNPGNVMRRWKGHNWAKVGAASDASSYWAGKKIVWFGTSIPEGGYGGDKTTAYPALIGAKLGATVYNEAVGSSSISRRDPAKVTAANPYGFDSTDFEFVARCIGDPLEVKEWIINNYNSGFFTSNVPAEMTDAIKERIRNYSYERKVDRYLDGGEVGAVDLYVFDHGYNDALDGERNIEELIAEHGIDNPYTYDSGMNFLIRRILASNPDAKIIMSGHYTDNAVTSQGSTVHSKNVTDAQKRVADAWNVKYLDLASHLGWSNQTITTTGYWNSEGIWVNSGGTEQIIQIKDVHIKDKTHPHTDASGKAVMRIADVLSALIESSVR